MEINKDTSYLIGLFQTDGTLSETTRNRGRASLDISIKDEDIIQKIKELIPYNYTIGEKVRNKKIVNKKGKIYDYPDWKGIFIKIYGLSFRNFLKESGIPVGKKSLIVKPPLHLKNLSIKDYIRGLYDGDGSIGMTEKNIPFVSLTTASSDIANFILDYISDLTKKPRKENNPNERDNVYNIMITKEDAIKFCDEIYYDNCLSINRKYDNSSIVKNWKRPINMKKIENKQKWTKEDDDFIMKNSVKLSMEKLNRSRSSIGMRLWRLNNKLV